MIAVINGAAKLQIQSWSPIALKNMQWEDESGSRKWVSITASGHLNDSPEIINLSANLLAGQDNKKDIAVRYHPSALYLATASNNKSVAKVLRLVNRKMDWTNLYRILEVISEDVGGYKTIVKQGWTSINRIDTFTGSANNSSVSGDDARHGKIQSGKPKETMDLREARHFIDKLIRKWLKAKVRGTQ